MNLRKLLCGLLAVCLLLTLAPAALMEELEAPVTEVIEEIGEVAAAEDVTVVTEDTPASTYTDYGKVALVDEYGNELTDTVEISLTDYKTDGFQVKAVAEEAAMAGKVSWTISNKSVAKPIKSADGWSYTFETLKAGKVKVTAKITSADGKVSKTLSITLKVVDDAKKAESVKIVVDPYDLSGDDYDSKAGTWNGNGVLFLEADVKPYSSSYPVTWTLDKITYATLNWVGDNGAHLFGKKQLKDIDSNDIVYLEWTGNKTGTVTVTAKSGSHKATLKIKVGPSAKKGIVFLDNSAFNSDKTEANAYLWTYNTKSKKFEKNSLKVYAAGVAKDDPTFVAKANDLRSFAWKSSKTSVATVAKTSTPGQAKISFKKAGRAKISVSKKDWAGNSFTMVIADNAPTGIKYVDNLLFPGNFDVEVKEVKIHKGQVATLVNMVDVAVPYSANDPVFENIFNSKGNGLTFYKKGSGGVTLLNTKTGKIRGDKVSDSWTYIWVKTFNGKKDYLKIKVIP